MPGSMLNSFGNPRQTCDPRCPSDHMESSDFGRTMTCKVCGLTWQAYRFVSGLPHTPVRTTIPDKLKIGDICSKCGKEWKERPLLTGTFVGCMC